MWGRLLARRLELHSCGTRGRSIPGLNAATADLNRSAGGRASLTGGRSLGAATHASSPFTQRSGLPLGLGPERGEGKGSKAFTTNMCIAGTVEPQTQKDGEDASSSGAKEEVPTEVFLKDYQAYPYAYDEVFLEFHLGEEKTIVHSVCKITSKTGGSAPLVLNGEDLVLKGLYVDGKPLVEGDDYELSKKTLVVKSPPGETFTLGCVTEIEPQNNTTLNGLYKSGGNFCTQCEAEGFRCITFYPDRPDVMSKFTVKIVAQKSKYPVLLSNGNLVASGDLESDQHFAVWVDPHMKPAYLFALVAGDYVSLEDTFTTVSGKDVDLKIWVQAHNSTKTGYAMESLKAAMKWDEERFGLEYDLGIFNIVAADDFNMGAMENKSLNIFNSRLVLASPETATDTDYSRIEGVIGHEYFHNWTGNRVTCRDWFQLSLKEGLTVFRDQSFSADMNSAPVKRIDDVIIMRARQFAEDAGPMAHPVRPASYIKMDNFYTITVYDKGAEVIRMYETLLGRDGFRKGMDLYFKRHDGQAVTTDDFYAAMEDANDMSLGNFKLWYSQAGTPKVKVTSTYDAAAKTFAMTCTQELPVTPDFKEEKQPQLIPINVGLVGPDGKDLPLSKVTEGAGEPLDISGSTSHVLKLSTWEQTFTFTDISVKPIPSILRNFSAPVKLVDELTSEDLKLLLANDSDAFNRWEAGQRLAANLILSLLPQHLEGKELVMDQDVVDAFKKVLVDESLDKEFRAYALGLPAVSELVDKVEKADPVAIYKVRDFVSKSLAQGMRDELVACFKACDSSEAYKPDVEGKSRRALRNTALAYLGSLASSDEEAKAIIAAAFKGATNMTDQIAGLGALCKTPGADREQALQAFYEQWKGEPLVLLKWLSLQAVSNIEGNLEVVKGLMDHEAFDIKNPNKVYSLIGGFAASTVNFHSEDGSGYEFLADIVLTLDKMNPQVAARMVNPFTKWRMFSDKNQKLMRAQLERIVKTKPISDNVYEIVFKSL